MSNLSRRSGSGVSRAQRERRAFRLVVVCGSAAVVALVLAIAGVIGSGLFWLALAVAIVSGIMFRQSVSRRR